MNLTRYRYSGPPSGASLWVGKKREALDVLLHPGKPVELPADHEYTLVLLALKHLQRLPTEMKSTAKTSASLLSAKE
ncbi:hypothetical protein [Pseudomonas mediterranea]|uniref:hypothetical protein n=1 Tax=Pseudomonas mediterranea TaxID=183795 RepID=UPI0006D8D0D2|nr:hypothetical protein [Pseudomonas mediterranea]MDU9028706.1 hypothetical protein [Pseudomonas mediterranea]